MNAVVIPFQGKPKPMGDVTVRAGKQREKAIPPSEIKRRGRMLARLAASGEFRSQSMARWQTADEGIKPGTICLAAAPVAIVDWLG
jgi:hypothetical protein